MLWNQSIPIFHLLLVILLAGDLKSHISVIADAIECHYGWSAGTRDSPYLCQVSANSTHKCKWCGRNDGLLPSALNCVDLAGHQVGGGQSWNCNLGITVDKYTRKDGRQILCQHIVDAHGGYQSYYCKDPNKNQQCPRELCTK
ncbi:uncharacterized protein MELLADRAFT_123552 [Melampsora larici-populina 98AG31]|uniref:Secreted protein n=1 Tax=Melampsora larici-populina (strain 98AG31 / pathotype 3-4-7) TaxID=747676 RepID=F4RV37_MELLP|nr:uncharacterized protein MELLADRAFT_123552 [Melampsora larici-populina 98AG31]EGG03822.1 secreted protein [Melampsora larici-populina 98AG31]